MQLTKSINSLTEKKVDQIRVWKNTDKHFDARINYYHSRGTKEGKVIRGITLKLIKTWMVLEMVLNVFIAPYNINKNSYLGKIYGGATGIRTLETVSRLHTFQACAFDHSATAPLVGV